jgi:hypothetical protein
MCGVFNAFFFIHLKLWKTKAAASARRKGTSKGRDSWVSAWRSGGTFVEDAGKECCRKERGEH